MSNLVEQFDLTQPAISSHLKTLEAAGLTSRSRKAQTRPGKLEPEGLKAVDVWQEWFREKINECRQRRDLATGHRTRA